MSRLVLLAVLAGLVAVGALSAPASAKPVCVVGSDCGYWGDGMVCTTYDEERGRWTDCVVDWGGCGVLYHRCIPPPRS